MRGRLSFQPAPTPGVRRSEPAVNSLFQNILRVTHLNAIFCEHKCISVARNLPEFNILRTSIQNPEDTQIPKIASSTPPGEPDSALDTVPPRFYHPAQLRHRCAPSALRPSSSSPRCQSGAMLEAPEAEKPQPGACHEKFQTYPSCSERCSAHRARLLNTFRRSIHRARRAAISGP